MDASIDIVRRIVPATESYFMVPAAATTTTWNPSDIGSNLTLSNGNKTVTKTTGVSGWTTVRATLSKNSGLRYFEIAMTAGIDFFTFGMAETGGNLNTQLGLLGNNDWGRDKRAGQVITVEGIFTGGADNNAGLSNGAVVGFAIDFSTGKIWVSNNGDFTIFNGSANPVTEVNPLVTFTGSPNLFPAVSLFGGDTVSATIAADSIFSFTPPTGYIGWSQ